MLLELESVAGRCILVTGASGMLGSRLVAELSGRGCVVHAFVRKTSRTDHLHFQQAKIFRGDIAASDTLRPAFAGVEYVIHTAADTTRGAQQGMDVTVQGTKNILDLCREFAVKKLVYISSCSVYGAGGYAEGQKVDERSPLEQFPEKRGWYSLAKFKAEQLVLRSLEEGMPVVCLRPGTYFGPRIEVFPPLMGFAVGRRIFIVIAKDKYLLPLVIIENLVDAIVKCLQKNESTGRVYNVLENSMPTKRQYVESFLKKLYPNALYLFVPYSLLYRIVRFQEIMFSFLKKRPILTTYRLESSQKSVIYDASKIRTELNWTPPVSMHQAFMMVTKYERGSM